jgi:glycosyltransferase involved in cell wall biosynthesis
MDSIISRLPKTDFEIIVVDDCSKDNTREIVSNYAQTHPQVKLFCQPQNHRQGAARNLGLKEAKGDYITYIDADDLVLDGFSKMCKVAKDTEADMIYGYMEIERPEGLFIHQLQSAPEDIMSGKEFADKYCADGVFYYPPSYIYKRSFLERINIPFVEERQHEDRDWLASVLVQAESVAVCPYTTYRYTMNPNSTCHALRYTTVFDHVASGIRHIDLSEQLKTDCPKLSATLYAFGVDEIHHSIRLRNLTKFPWSENKYLYDNQHLQPLLYDLKRMCRTYPMPREVRIVAYCPILTKLTTWLASPIATYIRRKKHQ